MHIGERTQQIVDAIHGKSCKRVLISPEIEPSYACNYAGIDYFRATWDYPELVRAYEKMLKDFPMDFNMGFQWLSPQKSEILGSRNWKQNRQNGVMQHPEVTTLMEEDYDEFIENPIACIRQKVLPRLHTKLAGGGMESAAALTRAMVFENTQMADFYNRIYDVSLAENIPAYYGAMFYAPFDLLADHLRGIRQISLDVRKRADKVEAACERLADVMVEYMKSSFPIPEEGFPLACTWVHLPPMINPRQFDRFFWPTFQKVCQELTEAGYHLYIQFQGDYTDGRYFDYYSTLPEHQMMIAVEHQDFRKTLETIGKKHLVSCSYPLRYLSNYSTKECIEKAKELMDMGMAYGNFYFGFDKPPISAHDAEPEKLKEVLEFVRDYGVY